MEGAFSPSPRPADAAGLLAPADSALRVPPPFPSSPRSRDRISVAFLAMYVQALTQRQGQCSPRSCAAIQVHRRSLLAAAIGSLVLQSTRKPRREPPPTSKQDPDPSQRERKEVVEVSCRAAIVGRSCRTQIPALPILARPQHAISCSPGPPTPCSTRRCRKELPTCPGTGQPRWAGVGPCKPTKLKSRRGHTPARREFWRKGQ